MADSDGTLPSRPQSARVADSGILTAGDGKTTIPEPIPRPQRDIVAAATQPPGERPGERMDERIAAVTAAGGLTALPPDFGDAEGDWSTVRAADPFTVLYLDYRQAERISPEVAARHHELLQRFWQEKLRTMTQGAARLSILKKYGGPEESERLVRSYPEVLGNAYQQLISRGAIDAASRKIVEEKEADLCARIDEKLDDFLVDSILQPEEVRALLLFGERQGLRAATVAKRIADRLRMRDFIAEAEPSGATLEARLLSTAWIHPSKRRQPPAEAIAQPQPPKPGSLTPLLLFSFVVVLVLLAGAALRSLVRVERSTPLATASSSHVPTTTTAEPATTTVVQSLAVPPPVVVPAPQQPAETREPEITTSVRHEEVAPVVSTEERRQIRDELASIQQDGDPQAGLDRLTMLERTLGEGEQYVDERIAAAKLRSQLERVVLLREVEAEKQAQEARAAAEREREWEQRLAAVEELMKQPNYSGAKTLADQLLAAPGIPPAVAARAETLRNQAVDELQKIFSSATVKSRTGRAPRKQP